jgi:hypothetical protein
LTTISVMDVTAAIIDEELGNALWQLNSIESSISSLQTTSSRIKNGLANRIVSKIPITSWER